MSEPTTSSNNSPSISFTDSDLPGAHNAANKASDRGQRLYLSLSRTRFIALLVAAVAGALGIYRGSLDFFGLVIMISFVVAAVAEAALIYFQPERNWYSGRAIAESTKTLAWRFAVQGEPFGPHLSEEEAEQRLGQRIRDVLKRGQDRIDIDPESDVVTDTMRNLRRASFETRRASYVLYRTQDQRRWYSDNARQNAKRATFWRWALLIGEVSAVVIAILAFGRDFTFDFAGIVAALVAAGAAWLAIKQHSQLASAYRVATGELALQANTLKSIEDQHWPQAVADAEEAISREHTMWLASRGQEPLGKV